MSPVVKAKKENIKIPSKYVLLFFVLLCLLLMILTFTGMFSDQFINNALGRVVVPFQKGIERVSGVFVDLADRKESYDELVSENKALKAQIDELTNENTLLLQDKYELTNLRELYGLDGQYADYDKIGARIISWDASNWFSSFTIDKGSEDGILVDMNVIAGSGLVGRITEVGKNWSKVTTIVDDSSNISAYVLHSQDNLMLSGDIKLFEQGYVKYSQLVDKDNVVAMGDKVVTSYISNKYLPGILIGYISSVDIDPNNLTKSGYITPVVDFSHLSDVLIIKELKEDYKED